MLPLPAGEGREVLTLPSWQQLWRTGRIAFYGGEYWNAAFEKAPLIFRETGPRRYLLAHYHPVVSRYSVRGSEHET